MNITVKFFSSLMEYLPRSAEGNAMVVQVNPGTSPRQVLARYRVPEEEVRTVMRNGVFLPEEDRDKPLEEGDLLTVWPSIQGG